MSDQIQLMARCFVIFLGCFLGFCTWPSLIFAQVAWRSGEILVKFKSNVSEEAKRVIYGSHGTSVMEYIPGLEVYRLKLADTQSVRAMSEIFSQSPLVEYAEPNALGQGGDFIPNDTFFSEQWQLHNTGQSGGTPDADIDAVEGWQITKGSPAIVAAVLDTGIESNHTEFQGRIVPGSDFVNEDDDPEADHPHGVLVTGVLGANTDNDFAGAGVDHRVSILPVKVLDEENRGTLFDLVQGLIFAADQGPMSSA